MNTLTIISIIAASITVIGSLVYFIKYIKKNILNIIYRIDEIEVALKSKQRFLIPKDTKVIIEETNKIHTLNKNKTIIIDKIENNMVYGKIFHNTTMVRLPLNNLGKEIFDK